MLLLCPSLLVGGTARPSSAFSLLKVPYHRRVAPLPAAATDAAAADDNKITVTFLCDTEFLSDPSTTNNTKNDAQTIAGSFLEQADSSLLLLMMGEEAANTICSRSFDEILDTDEKEATMQRWTAQAQTFGAAIPSGLPASNERICDLSTPAVSFPGFSILSNIQLGVKYVEGEYQFVQLKDATEAKGLRALVWAHDKVTGKDTSSAVRGSQRARSYCTISPVVEDERQPNVVRFQYRVFLEVQLQFPRILVNLLPVRLKKVNAWGSQALTKTVTQNGPPNLRRLHDAFESYMKDSLLL